MLNALRYANYERLLWIFWGMRRVNFTDLGELLKEHFWQATSLDLGVQRFPAARKEYGDAYQAAKMVHNDRFDHPGSAYWRLTKAARVYNAKIRRSSSPKRRANWAR